MKSIKIIIISLLLCCGIEQASGQYGDNPAQDQGIFWQIMDSVRHGIQTVVTGIWNFVVVKPIKFVFSPFFSTTPEPSAAIQPSKPEVKKSENSQPQQSAANNLSMDPEWQNKESQVIYAKNNSKNYPDIYQEAPGQNINVIENVEEVKKELTPGEQDELDLQKAITLSLLDQRTHSENIIIEEDFLAQDDDGNTSLHRAISDSQQDEVMRILKKVQKQGRTVELLGTFNRAFQTPLHLAAQSNNTRAVASIINAYPDSIRIKNNSDQTPPELAENENNHQLAQEMRALAAQRRILSGNTNILINSLKDNPKLFQKKIGELLKLGASLEERDEEGNTPLHITIKHGTTLRVAASLLIEAHNLNKDILFLINNHGETPLHLAVQYFDHQQLINFFNYLSSKISKAKFYNVLKIQDNNGNTPLHIAARDGKTHMISALIEKCQESASIQNNSKETPAQLATNNGHDEIASKILKASKTSHNIDTNSPSEIIIAENPQENIIIIPDLSLHNAIQNGESSDTIKSILNEAQKQESLLDLLRTKNDEGDTPFHLAVQLYDTAAFNSFLKLCSDTVEEDNKLIFQTLLNIQNSVGNTPLHIAAEMNKAIATTALIQYDVNVSIKNNNNQTPLDCAIEKDSDAVAKIIYDKTNAKNKYNLDALINQAQTSKKVLTLFNRIKAQQARLAQHQKQNDPDQD